MKSRGLGDDIEKYITKPLGIKKVVDTVADALDADCGCEKRKEKLNQWFPKKGTLTKDEHEFLEYFFDNYNGTKLKDARERDVLYSIYNRVNKAKEQPTSCSPCLKRIVENLRTKLNEY